MAGKKLYLQILGMFLCNTIAGLLNITGTIAPYIISYYHSINSSLQFSSIILISLIAIIVQILNFFLISYLVITFDEIHVLSISLIISAISMFFSSYIQDPYIFIVIFGSILGIYASALSFPAVWKVTKQMPENLKGLMAGVGFSSIGLSPFLYGLAFTLIVNPHNLPPEGSIRDGDNEVKVFGKNVYDNFPIAVRGVSLIILAVGVIGAALLLERKNSSRVTNEYSYSLTLRQVLGMYSFWYIYAIYYTKMLFFFFIVNVYKTLGLLYINDEYFLVYVSGIGFFLSAVSRILYGKMLDRFNWVKLNAIEAFLELLCGLFYYSALEYRYLYAFVTVACLTLTPSTYLSVWVITGRVFPKDRWVISLISSAGVFSLMTVFFFTIVVAPVRTKQELGFDSVFYLVNGIQLAAIILICYSKFLTVHSSKLLVGSLN